MTYIGLDHSTTALKIAIIGDDGDTDTFSIERIPDDPNEWSLIERLSDYVDIAEVNMMATGYSYGDDLSAIVPVSEPDNRGVVDHMGAGHGFGTGTKAYDELTDSDIPAIVYPGVNDTLETLDPYFTEMSMITGADTLAMTRYAQELIDEEDASFISCSVSSSVMSTVVRNGRIRGAFHWLGLVHGIIDPCILRQIDNGEVDPRNAYMKAGMLARRDGAFEDVKDKPSEEILERICDAVKHNVYGLLPFAGQREELDGVVLSGRFTDVTSPVDIPEQMSSELQALCGPFFCRSHSSAVGAALIARDAARGKRQTLGVPIQVEA